MKQVATKVAMTAAKMVVYWVVQKASRAAELMVDMTAVSKVAC